jgi:ribosome recycling factor
MNMVEDALELATDAMEKVLERLHKDLGRVRTGRANPALLEEIRVDNYGSMMPINQIASVSIADARMLVVKPWDRNSVQGIERAIANAGLGLNPSNDGLVVRVPIPPLTQERRQQLVKVVRDEGENARIAVRQARREGNDFLKAAEKSKEISEDQLKSALDKVQALTDSYIKKIDESVAKKEAAILDG